jgi:hypothetical protein
MISKNLDFYKVMTKIEWRCLCYSMYRTQPLLLTLTNFLGFDFFSARYTAPVFGNTVQTRCNAYGVTTVVVLSLFGSLDGPLAPAKRRAHLISLAWQLGTMPLDLNSFLF